MTAFAEIIAFGGDHVHASDTARCEALLGAAMALGVPSGGVTLVLGYDGTQGVTQDAHAALQALQALMIDQPDAMLLFSATDAFSAHVARLLCATTGAPWGATLTGLQRDHAICVDAHGSRRQCALSSGQILLVDERYFLRVPIHPPQIQHVRHDAAHGTANDHQVPPDAVALPDAAFILAAGDGVSDWDAFAEVARLLQISTGASKVVCDKGRQPRDRQVGSSGASVAPRAYVALGISGSTQHLQGIASTTRILAVNTDPNAPMVQRAELALILDANALLRALRTALQPQGAQP